MKRFMSLLLVLALAWTLWGCQAVPDSTQPSEVLATVHSSPTQTSDPSLPPETQATVAKPAETEAPKTEPTQTEPPQTEPEQTQPLQTEPEQTQPPQTDPPETRPQPTEPSTEPSTEPADAPIDVNGTYTHKDDVALYIHTYGRLPDNFITKKEAQALGWKSGGLDKYAYGKCIGGDRFGNYEGLLPKKSGRVWYECDIDTLHAKNRGSKRICYSNDGLIYYTSDHYGSFTKLYGAP